MPSSDDVVRLRTRGVVPRSFLEPSLGSRLKESARPGKYGATNLVQAQRSSFSHEAVQFTSELSASATFVVQPLPGNMIETGLVETAAVTNPSELFTGARRGVRDEVVARAVAKGVFPDVAVALVDDAPDQWWESTSVPGLAADLVLLAPGLAASGPSATDEVRVRITAGSSDWELSVVAADRPGLLATTAEVLADNGLSIEDARIATWKSHALALQRLRVTGPARSSVEPDFPYIGQVLHHRLALPRLRPSATTLPDGCAVRSVVNVGLNRWMVEVQARNEVGLLARVADALHGLGANVLVADVHSEGPIAIDTFLIELEDESSLAMLRALATSAI
jgi:glycine cleavage system regulatory protein